MILSPRDIQRSFWALSAGEALELLETSYKGLGDAEAKRRRALFGFNAFLEKRRPSHLAIFLGQFRSPLILILLFAGGVTVVLEEFGNAIVIFAAVLANTMLGYYQEYKAESAISLLQSYIKRRARVVRGDNEMEIEASELVPGDVIRLLPGDRVPADARFIFINDLQADESILTGESLPVSKTVEPASFEAATADRSSMAFSGTLIVQGMGDAAITAIGADTELGKIAHLVSSAKEEPTPLQSAIQNFSLKASIVLGAMVVGLFLLGIWYGYGIFEVFLISVAVAVSAVPEALPIALTVILAIGVQRIAKQKGIVRKLVAAETLGSTTLILTDKTGTLTEAKMEIGAVIPFGPDGKDDHRQHELLRIALLNSEAAIENPDEAPPTWRIIGRALEVALVRGAAREGLLMPEVVRNAKIVDRLPFSSLAKYSGALLQTDGHYLITLVGAPEILLAATTLTPRTRAEAFGAVNELAYAGARVVGVARKEIREGMPPASWKKKLYGFEFAGLIAFSDPVRATVKDAIARIHLAGVRTVIVTGDHQGTAEAVAKAVGFSLGPQAVLTGPDLELMGEAEFSRLLPDIQVFARVSPEQKLQIAKAYKNRGETVAMTGDGVNDAPALKEADIGIAVGSGTDVAKSVADLVILDDNFETIVAAIEEGRKILENIRKVLVYLLSNALDALLLIGGALLMGVPIPLNALQILWVNFFTDSFPAIALSFEHGDDDVGTKPKRLHKNLFDPEMRFLVLVIGTLTSFLLFAAYAALLAMEFDPTLVRTFIFASFGLYSLFLVFSVRSLHKSIFEYNFFSNPYLLASAGIGFALMALAIYWPPLQTLLETIPLTWPWALGVIAIGLANIVAIELGKLLYRRRDY
ncbi:MAG: HAD-IC family P-type ATPase [bacterium]|nr:HAD-IC family P-type ATPase [bacterium]